MNENPVIELREYEKKSADEHEILKLDEKLDLKTKKKLEEKGILKISGDAFTGSLKFEAFSQIGVAQFANFTKQ